MEALDYRSKSPAACQMGKAAELLVAAFCILSTEGQLNVSTTVVDDEGVDLVFNRRESSDTLAVQVKARMSSAKTVEDRTFRALVRANVSAARRPGAAVRRDRRGQWRDRHRLAGSER